VYIDILVVQFFARKPVESKDYLPTGIGSLTQAVYEHRTESFEMFKLCKPPCLVSYVYDVKVLTPILI
jgi:hypothetical protein